MPDITKDVILVCPSCGKKYVGNSWDLLGDADYENDTPWCPVDKFILEIDIETVL